MVPGDGEVVDDFLSKDFNALDGDNCSSILVF
ncbi:hypothetical protein J2747_002107 [Thermococcus stetteri]|nr:hypothetical protein [Thermococcus stetteri]